MTISLRLNDEDTLLIKKYAEINRISVSDKKVRPTNSYFNFRPGTQKS